MNQVFVRVCVYSDAFDKIQHSQNLLADHVMPVSVFTSTSVEINTKPSPIYGPEATRRTRLNVLLIVGLVEYLRN